MTWSDLFGDGSEQTTIELIRMAPAFVGDVSCTGYCGNIQPGASLQTIKDLYGGGKYKLQKKVNGQFQKGGFRYLEIVGTPIIPERKTALLAPESPVVSGRPAGPLASGPAAAGSITVDGLTLPTDFAAFKQSLMEIMMLKAALREPDPLNTELLKIALNQAGPKDELTSMLTAISKIKDIASELQPAAAASDGWMGLISKGLDAFGTFMKTKQSALGSAMPFVAAPEPAGTITAKEQPLLLESPAENPPVIGEDVTLQQKILAGLNIIVAGFRLRPPMAIHNVVELLAEQLSIQVPERGMLLPFRNSLFNKAELMLADDFLDADDDQVARADFTSYFTQIFDLYCGVKP